MGQSPTGMILHPGESVLMHGGATLHAGVRLTPGRLVLSSHRMVFETGGAMPFTVIDLGLERVWNVHAGSVQDSRKAPPREFLTVETSYGRSVFEVQAARTWAETIVKAKYQIPAPTAPPPPPPPPQPPGVGGGIAPIVVNVAAPPAPKIMLTCRYCGNLFDAVGGRCDKCGARP